MPWFNAGIRKKMKQRRAVYRREGRSRNWRELKNICKDMLERAKKAYYDRTVKKLTAKNSIAYTAIKALRDVEAPKPWQARQLKPESTVEEMGEEMADFFAKISKEFSPLALDSVPLTHDKPVKKLNPEEVEKTLKRMNAPKSYVTFDPPPSIIGPCSTTFAKIMTPIMNEIGNNKWWPSRWKMEEVTVIPKKTMPESLDQCRNISCTSIFSKLAETYMMEEIRQEIKLNENQYGGSLGSGTGHLLCDLTTDIMRELDQGEHVVSLMAVDFAKAFNRMSHDHCLTALAKKGASNQTINKVASFLSNRSMRIRQGNKLSAPRETPRGPPKGRSRVIFSSR